MEDMEVNYWEGKKVFITGYSGLLGSWLTKQLIEKDAQVIGLQRDITPEPNFYSFGLEGKISLINGSIEDFYILKQAILKNNIDTIFHLAAQPIVEKAIGDPLTTFKSNIMGTWNILEACRLSPIVRRVVIASSDKAYGEHNELPYIEDAPLKGQYPYDVSKSCSDLLAQCYYHTYGLPVGIVRCGNIYGGGDLNFSRIVPGSILSLLKNKQIVIRSDGKFIRDYLYVKDAVSAYLTLAQNLYRKEIRGQAFNFGTNMPISVLDLIKRIIIVSKSKDPKIKILNKVKNEIREQYLLCKKAEELLGWKVKYDLDKGLEETYQWYATHFKKGNLK